MTNLKYISEIICKVWKSVQERIENGYCISSEKTLCFLFSIELIKETGFDIEIDFENQCYKALKGNSRYLDLLIKYSNISIAIEFKFPTKSDRGNSNKAEVRKAIYRDLARLEYLKQNKIADKCYFLMATNETSYLNKGKHTKYIDYCTHQECKISKDRNIETEGIMINNEVSFEWGNISSNGKKYLINGKYAWLSPIII